MFRIFCLTACIYVALRLLFVAALGDVFLYGEELEKGAVALSLLDGVDLPYARLPFHPYEGGGFVASHVKALAFLALGENLLAHKLASLAWGVLLVGATVLLLYRSGESPEHPRSRAAAALLGGLLLALGPAHLQKQSLLHLGIHYEALLFIALVFHFGLRVASVRRGESVPRRTLLMLGLTAGFGTYFSYQVPIAVLAVILLLAFTDWRRIFAPPLVIATLIGLVPLGLMYAAVGSEILDIHGSKVGDGGGWTRMWHAVSAGLAKPLASAMLAFGVVAAAAGLRFAPLRGERGRAAALLAGYAVLWTLFAGWTGMIQKVGADPHWVRFIRFAPLVFTLLLLVALIAAPAVASTADQRRTTAARIARTAVTIMVAIGGVHAARTIDEGELGSAGSNLARLASLHGYELRGAWIKIAPRIERTGDTARERAEAMAPFAVIRGVPADFLASELASAVAQDIGDLGPDEVLEALAAATSGVTGEPPRRDALARGLGAVVFRSVGGDVYGALMRDGFDPRYAEALGRSNHGFLSLPPYLGEEMTMVRDTPLELEFLHGFGRRVFRCGVLQPYWGPECVLRPGALRARAEELARASGAREAAVAALLAGIDAAAADFGVPFVPSQGTSPTLPE